MIFCSAAVNGPSAPHKLTPVLLASALENLDAPILPVEGTREYEISIKILQKLPKLIHRQFGLLTPTNQVITHLDKRTYKVTCDSDGTFTYVLAGESPGPVTLSVATEDLSKIVDQGDNAFVYFALYLPKSQPFLAYSTLAHELGLDLEPLEVAETIANTPAGLRLQGKQVQVQQSKSIGDRFVEAPVRVEWTALFKCVRRRILIDLAITETHGEPIRGTDVTDSVRTGWIRKFDPYWEKRQTEHIEVTPVPK